MLTVRLNAKSFCLLFFMKGVLVKSAKILFRTESGKSKNICKKMSQKIMSVNIYDLSTKG